MTMIAVTGQTHLSLFRKPNVWYSITDGNFTSPSTWISNGAKKNGFPQSGDTVYISHVVSVASHLTVKRIYVSGTLKFSNNVVLTVTDDVQITGFLNQSANSSTLSIGGFNNFIVNFVTNTTSTIRYAGIGDQEILPLAYNNLELAGYGYKNIYDALTIAGTLLIINSSIVMPVILRKVNNTGKLTFGGLVQASGNTLFPGIITNPNNADLEFNTGINTDGRGLKLDFGTGNLYLNGPAIQISYGGGGGFGATAWFNYNNIIIKGSSIVTVTSSNNTALVICGVINGETSSSTLRIAGMFMQNTPVEPMTTGVFVPNYASTSIMGYLFNGDYTLPYTTYSGLVIGGTGTKYLPGNTTLATTYNGQSSGKIELGAYDFAVGGVTTLVNAAIIKSGAGTVLLTGVFTGAGSLSYFQMKVPDITVELRGGWNFDQRNFVTGGFVIASGSKIKCTTNTQTFQNGPGQTTIDGDFIISGAITVNCIGNQVVVNGIVNGDNAASKLSMQQNNSTTPAWWFKNPQQPMQTGILDCNSTPNITVYGYAGNQDITPGTYRYLTLNGTGSKRLLGNVSVINAYILTAPAALNTNGFVLTNP